MKFEAGERVTVMLANAHCVRATVKLTPGASMSNFCAEPTARAWAALLSRGSVSGSVKGPGIFPWRYLTPEDEGTYWVRGWSKKNADALKVAAALANGAA